MNNLLYWLEMFGVVVLAISGGFQASIRRLDITGFVLVAVVTGVGGGTLRDILLYHGPVFWVREPLWLWLTISVAVLVYFTAPFVERRSEVLLWTDALGLAALCVVGTQAGLDAGASASIAILIGIMAAIAGGVIRDVVCSETPLIRRKEIYVAAAAAGAAVLVVSNALDLPSPVAVLGGVAVALAIRAGALFYGLSLYRPAVPNQSGIVPRGKPRS
jgi:uncharacterized membrane protein YeiH